VEIAMLLILLSACAGPVYGTWMFTEDVTLPTGEECTDSVSHNFVGAYEPIAVGDDPSWTETDTGELSPEVFFGRVERTADGAVMIVGSDALPGTQLEDGSWLFFWTNTSTGSDSLDHVTGYAFDHSYTSSSTLRIAGTLQGSSFEGTWESETAANDAWTESDTWSDEAAGQVGSNGSIPASTYLLRIDDTGAESAATNSQLAYDCGDAGCTLTVQETCAYRYTLTGQATDFAPDDSRWVEDAGQAAGN
jgi:hypothetical protein